MRKVNREFLNSCRKSCTDYIHKNNSENLRERFVFYFSDGCFIRVEGNTEGWYTEDKDLGFSSSIHWVNRT